MELCSHLVQHSDENTAKSRVVPVSCFILPFSI